MTNDRCDINTDLRTREPLRIAFAIGALLLGLVASMHPDTNAVKPDASGATSKPTQP
ncbi:MAG: hypothetical protein ABI451_04285 [Dokdonella sp.]